MKDSFSVAGGIFEKALISRRTLLSYMSSKLATEGSRLSASNRFWSFGVKGCNVGT